MRRLIVLALLLAASPSWAVWCPDCKGGMIETLGQPYSDDDFCGPCPSPTRDIWCASTEPHFCDTPTPDIPRTIVAELRAIREALSTATPTAACSCGGDAVWCAERWPECKWMAKRTPTPDDCKGGCDRLGPPKCCCGAVEPTLTPTPSCHDICSALKPNTLGLDTTAHPDCPCWGLSPTTSTPTCGGER